MFITNLKYGNDDINVILDDNMKQKFLTFPCEWQIREIDGHLYVFASAYSKGISTFIYLHQLVLNCEKDEKVLFCNRNTLDNRMDNLRLVSNLPKRVVKG